MGICPSLWHTGDETNFVLTVHVQQLGLLLVELWERWSSKSRQVSSRLLERSRWTLGCCCLGNWACSKDMLHKPLQTVCPFLLCSAHEHALSLGLEGAGGGWVGLVQALGGVWTEPPLACLMNCLDSCHKVRRPPLLFYLIFSSDMDYWHHKWCCCVRTNLVQVAMCLANSPKLDICIGKM